MSDWRKIAFNRIIDHAASIMSNRICSDTPRGIIDLIPQDERVPLSKEFEEYNSDGKDFDGTDSVTGQDWILLYALWNRTENQLTAAQAQNLELKKAVIDLTESINEIIFDNATNRERYVIEKADDLIIRLAPLIQQIRQEKL